MQGAKEIKRGGKLSGSAGNDSVNVLRAGISPEQHSIYRHGLFQSGVSAYFLDIILNLPLLIDRPKRYYGHLVQIILGPTHQ